MEHFPDTAYTGTRSGRRKIELALFIAVSSRYIIFNRCLFIEFPHAVSTAVLFVFFLRSSRVFFSIHAEYIRPIVPGYMVRLWTGSRSRSLKFPRRFYLFPPLRRVSVWLLVFII